MVGLAVAGAVGATGISLSEAVALALENSSEMAAAHAQIDFADQSVRAAGAGSLPTLALSGSYGQFSGDVLFGRFIPGVPGDGAADVGAVVRERVIQEGDDRRVGDDGAAGMIADILIEDIVLYLLKKYDLKAH